MWSPSPETTQLAASHPFVLGCPGQHVGMVVVPPTEGLIAKNPTTPFDPGAVDPVAAMKKAARLAREREQSATPVVRLVWIGGSAGAMQLVNVYVHVSAILSA